MESIQRFQELLKGLFQFEASDLDFGIYRVLNYKRDRIEKFIQVDLKNKVESAFAKHKDERLTDIHQRFEEAKERVIQGLGQNAFTPTGELKEEFKDTPLGRDYLSIKAQKDEASAIDEIKLQVFNDLYNFFSRYYEEGDFVPHYRYSIKGHRYAIPYNGEEVKLYWANSEQYYTKTGLLFRDYTFRAGNYKVVFRVVSAREEIASNKATKERFFVLDDENPLMSDNEVLIIRFQYRELTNEEIRHYEVEGGSNLAKQEKINQKSYDELFNKIQDFNLKRVLSDLYKNDKPLLLYQISRFTAKNTKDYFIHKNLKKFLSEQLDYFIKSEVLDIETLEKERFLDKHITRAKVVREIGEDIIDFLSQIEDFQKRLWEKKKFVLRTEYVITTDRVPEEFYQEIWNNKEQKKEWKDLGFEIPKTKKELKNKKLPIDTKYFSREFKEKLLEKLTENADLDDLLDGLLIKSENWQALNLLLNKYKEKVQTIYIDPPYNTGNDEFLYKDKFKHSSWLSFLQNRISIGKLLMSTDGVFFTSIDDNEQNKLTSLLMEIYGEENFVNQIIWQKKYSPQNDAKWLSDNHDFITCFAKNKELWRPTLLARTEEQNARYQNPDNDPRGPWKSSGLDVKTYSAEYDYPIKTPSGRIVNPPKGRCWRCSKEKFEELVKDNRIWFGPDGNSVPSIKRFLSEVKKGITPLTIWTYQEVGHNQEATQELKNIGFVYSSPKPVRLLKKIIHIGSKANSIVLDFFAGSGTTAHAVMKLNKDDGGKRKFILVEMADYFDTIIIPRIKKVAYSFNWKDGKPQDTDGIGVFFKYQVLEQYEDSLDNIELKENHKAQELFNDEYLLKYFLDFETRESPYLLNIEMLKNPFAYKLKVNLKEVGEPEEMVVDIPETFNYLSGLKVKKVKARNNGRKYLFILGEKQGKDIAIIWREYDDKWGEEEFKKDKEFIIKELEPWAPHIVYINGQTVLTPNLGKHTAEIRYIEPEFKKLMEV